MFGEKIRSQDSRPYICDDEMKVEGLLTNCNCAVAGSVAKDVGSVGRLQLDAVGAAETLLRRRWQDAEQGSAVDEPLLASTCICYV